MTPVESHREHGTHVKYVVDGCRCDECVLANNRYERERRARIDPPYVAAGPAREHCRELMAAGVGLKQIAKASGVSHGALSKLIYGDHARGRGPSKRIRPETMSKILAVTPSAAAGGARVAAGPTWKLLDEMIAAGVPKAQIAEQLGQRGPGLQLSRNLITSRNARAVVGLHRRWKTGAWVPERRSKHGTRPLPAPVPVDPPSRTPVADISDLMLDLAEIIEERNAQPWRSQAACRTRPTWMWFPARGDHDTTNRALKVCRSCLVRDECRAANLDKRDGIYGALTAKARRDLRSADTTPRQRPKIVHGTNAGYCAHIRAGEEACADCRQAHARYVQDARPSRARGAA